MTTPPDPFERFARRLYARPGMEEALLDLQDRHAVDVVLLLWFLWRASNAETPDAAQAARAQAITAAWSSAAIRPLRAVRRRLRQPGPVPDPARERVREAVKAAELEAELALVAALEPLGGTPDRTAGIDSALGACEATRTLDPVALAPLRHVLGAAGLAPGATLPISGTGNQQDQA